MTTCAAGAGKYLIVKDPNKPLVRLYELPKDAFASNYIDQPAPEPEPRETPAPEAPPPMAPMDEDAEA